MSKIEVDAIDKQSGSTLTLGGSGTAVTLACGATQSGFGRTGTVDWQTSSIKTTTFTAANGEGYFADTSSGAFTMNLPAGTAGNIVSVVDYTNTFQTHNLTITPNGSQKIGGTNANATLSTEGQSVTFVYVDDTEGWKNVQDSTSNAIGRAFLTATGGTVTTSGDFKIHSFTGPGTFCVSALSNVAADNTVSYIVVAGGGGGSGQTSNGGGGAGAGGFREFKGPADSYTASPLNGSTPITVTATAFPITVGAGGVGPAQSSNGAWGTKGSNSQFSTIISAGGGQGSSHISACYAPNMSGGSGGGGYAGTPSVVGTGNTPPVSPSQGSNGAPGTPSGPLYSGGGGGGATAVGVTGTAPKGGDGGAGATTSITGTPTAYAGGGGAGVTPSPGANPSTIGAGGTGGTVDLEVQDQILLELMEQLILVVAVVELLLILH